MFCSFEKYHVRMCYIFMNPGVQFEQDISYDDATSSEMTAPSCSTEI